MTTKLSQIQDSYSISEKVHGTVALGPKTQYYKKNTSVPYLYLAAKGDAVKDLTDPHITIWGNEASDSKITSVEFSWAGARHVYYSPSKKTFSAPNIPTSDKPVAAKLQLLLELFLNAAGIATITTTAAATTTTAPTTPIQSHVNLSSSSPTYRSDFPALGQ
ncbi:hypothetical protein DYQ86_25775 [Acidobacteria bacterium AB60]|nr:hypothetical protein DYQ86_25775 [Acidobacteria bacterium AB60]